MKLNQDCLRDLMLYLEDTLTMRNYILIDCYSNDTFLEKYNIDDLRYTALKLIEANYIDASTRKFLDVAVPEIRIKSITFTGHKFLDTIRDDKVWKKTKNVLSGFKSTSIEIISETASKVITNLINQQLGI